MTSVSNQSMQTNLHVITENGEQCFMWKSSQLTYIAQDRQELPLVLATKFGPFASKLDLSYNTLTSCKNIGLFANLHELILDNNLIGDEQLREFRLNLRLKILSLNKNKLTNLYKLVNLVKNCFPNLEFLSLIGNPLCPTSLASTLLHSSNSHSSNNGRVDHENNENYSAAIPQIIDDQKVDSAYQKYRYFIIYHLPNLRFLDSKPIDNQERDEALKRCFWMNTDLAGKSSLEQQQQQQQQANNGRANGLAGNEDGFTLTIMSDHQPDLQRQRRLNEDNDQIRLRGAFSRLSYKYTGKNSEGNRFIRNNDL